MTAPRFPTFLPPAPALLAPLPAWFSAQGRRLPWRAENLDLPHPDPYAVLVSELMLQQTQVSTVVPYFNRWMNRFPDPRTLALAEDDAALKFWEGLGYYRRARFLKQAATIIANQGWPGDLKGLLALPGLGPYTAAALASIAFLRPEPALDGNAFRVLARLLGIQDDPKRHAAQLREWLRPGLSVHGPSRITQAVMELGATICGPRPDCARCPLASACEALRQGLTDRIPPPAKRTSAKSLAVWLVAIEAQEHWLLLRPAAKGLLAGLWRWPVLAMVPDHAAPVAAEACVPYLAWEARTWKGWSQSYSHRKEQVAPVALRGSRIFPAPSAGAWVTRKELDTLPLGKRDQRLRDLLSEATSQDAAEIPIILLLQRIMAGEP